jgi:DNA mismatch repair protein MutL
MQQNSATIQTLPQSVVEKIAAGEVIERPSSVLKELVENALDAGADRIDITVEDAGFSLIKVTDNGCGIPAGQIRTSLKRHTTSKIDTFDDIYSLSTFGFRGEALASIAAVSRTTLQSSCTDDGLGYSVACEGERIGERTPVSHLHGTTVTVADLFFNVPARRKFMRTRKGERTAIMRLMEQLVIPFPTIHFTARAEGKTVLDCPPVQTPSMRIAQVAGAEFAQNLIVASRSSDVLNVNLLVSNAANGARRPRFQNLYVNLRRIDSDSITHAIREAYSRFVHSQLRPSFFCFLDIDPDKVDVNVHPTKQKIKFDNEHAVFGFIYKALETVFVQNMPQSLVSQDQSDREQNPAIPPAPEPSYDLSVPRQRNKTLSETDRPVLNLYSSSASPPPDTGMQVTMALGMKNDGGKKIGQQENNSIQLTEGAPDELWELITCYQIHETYILASIKGGIMLVDQHAAHERILFEQAIEGLEKGRTESQQLLFPIVIELSPAEKQVIEAGKDYLNRFGFSIEDFGGKDVAVSAIPAFVKPSQGEKSVREIVEYLLDERSVKNYPEPQKRMAAAFACGAAIKAGQKLTQEEMNALLNNLFATKTPYVCPHGRPTVIRISLGEIERRFMR